MPTGCRLGLGLPFKQYLTPGAGTLSLGKGIFILNQTDSVSYIVTLPVSLMPTPTHTRGLARLRVRHEG